MVSAVSAAGEVRPALFDGGVEAVRTVLDDRVGLGDFQHAPQLFVRGVGIAPEQVVADGAAEEGVLLQDDRDLLAQRFQVIAFDGVAADDQLASLFVVKSGQELDQGGLAGAGGTNDRERFALVDFQADARQVLVDAAFVLEGEVADREGAVVHLVDWVGRIVELGLFFQNFEIRSAEAFARA